MGKRQAVALGRLIELGFRQGGPAGYGLRRVLVDQGGVLKGELNHGERKSLQTDRVILVPRPACEVRIVNLIYQWFIDESLGEHEIAVRLNAMNVRTDLGRQWMRSTVRDVLTNEKYIGIGVTFNAFYVRRTGRPVVEVGLRLPPGVALGLSGNIAVVSSIPRHFITLVMRN